MLAEAADLVRQPPKKRIRLMGPSVPQWKAPVQAVHVGSQSTDPVGHAAHPELASPSSHTEPPALPGEVKVESGAASMPQKPVMQYPQGMDPQGMDPQGMMTHLPVMPHLLPAMQQLSGMPLPIPGMPPPPGVPTSQLGAPQASGSLFTPIAEVLNLIVG